MEIKRYIFQSPYPSPVQIGREDPSAKQKSQNSELIQNSNQTLQDAKVTQNSLQKEPTVQVHKLDLYA